MGFASLFFGPAKFAHCIQLPLWVFFFIFISGVGLHRIVESDMEQR